MKKEKIKTLISFFIGIGVLLYIFKKIGWSNLSLITKVEPKCFIAASFFYIVTDILAAMMLFTLMPKEVRSLGFPSIFLAHLAGMLYSNATPGRVGYYYAAFSLARKAKVSKAGNIGLLTLFQGINFFVKAIATILAILYFSSLLIKDMLLGLVAIVVPIFFVFVILIFLYTNLPRRIIAEISFLKPLSLYLERMQNACKNVEKSRILAAIFLSFLGWLTMALQWYFIALSLGIKIDFLSVLMLQPLLTAIMFLPISPSGLGFTEGGSALLFKFLGFSLSEGVVFMILIRINSLMIDSFGILELCEK